ncbi:MAG: diadenylate cyclase [Syntrophobacteraceae bacterium]|nr:diadenylate cyclase [Syntrophobacteraceae bacterium]
MPHANARDLALYVADHWNDTRISGFESTVDCGPQDNLPEPDTLEHILSCCYQASLMREEDRAVRFRLILRAPGCFDGTDGPPRGLHRLTFSEPRAFDEYELQRLSPAVDFYRSMIGVCLSPQKRLFIWGIVHSGSRWVQNVYGGKVIAPRLPPSLVVYVTDPGRITVCRGPITIATLNRGQVLTPTHEVFDSTWLPGNFAPVRSRLWAMHLEARQAAQKPWANLDPSIVRTIAQQVVRRIISSVRNSGHGGTILVVPPEIVDHVFEENSYLNIEYRVTDKTARKRFQTLVLDLMNTLAEVYGPMARPGKSVGWEEYVASGEESLALCDEAVFDLAQFFADLASVDGAVVFSEGFELLGFGAMISGGLKGIRTVARALDIEGAERQQVYSGSFGSRHRSVFRFCNEVHDAIAIVISQDRVVRFVKWKEGVVTYWDGVATSIMDF